MVQNPIYRQFAERFASASIQSLVDSFNSEVGQYAWHYSRSLHDAALIDEFVQRGIDISAIRSEIEHEYTFPPRNNRENIVCPIISFAHKVRYDDEQKKLVIADGK